MAQIITPVMGAFTPIKYSLKLVELLYNDTLYPYITNTQYEGQIKESGDRVRVRTAGKISLSTYTKGMELVKQELTPTYEDLIIDQQQYFAFGVDKLINIVHVKFLKLLETLAKNASYNVMPQMA